MASWVAFSLISRVRPHRKRLPRTQLKTAGKMKNRKQAVLTLTPCGWVLLPVPPGPEDV